MLADELEPHADVLRFDSCTHGLQLPTTDPLHDYVKWHPRIRAAWPFVAGLRRDFTRDLCSYAHVIIDPSATHRRKQRVM